MATPLLQALDRNLPVTFVPGFHNEDNVRKMKYRKLGNTRMEVSVIGFGGTDFGSVYIESSDSSCTRALHCAVKNGINYIDTAPFYYDSEIKLGKALKGIPRQAYYIATKIGRYDYDKEDSGCDFSYERTLRSVDESLSRLGVEYIDLIQVHDFDIARSPDIIINETLPALQKVKENGKARFIGINGYSHGVFKEVLERSEVKVDTVLSHCRATMLDSSLTEHLTYFMDKDLGVINASPFAAGLLIDRPLPSWHVAKLPQYRYLEDTCKKALSYCKERNVDLAKLALHHSLKLSDTTNIATTLVGMLSVTQVENNLRTLYNGLTETEQTTYQEVMKRFLLPLGSPNWEAAHAQLYKNLHPDTEQCWFTKQ